MNEECLCFYINIIYELCILFMLILGLLEDLLSDVILFFKYVNKISIIYDSVICLLNLINCILEFCKIEI